MLLLYNNNTFTNQKDSFYFTIAKHLFIKHLAIASQIIFTLNAIYKKIKKSVDKCNCQRLVYLLLIELSLNHSRASCHHTIIRNVMHHQTTSGNNTSVSDGNTW